MFGNSGDELNDNVKSFQFRNVIAKQSEDQEVIYNLFGPKLLERVLDNKNSTCIVMGPPRSGKSYTFHSAPSPELSTGCCSFPVGSSTSDDDKSSHAGVFPRFCADVFQEAKTSNFRHPVLEISFFQLYGEKIIDLLAPNDNKHVESAPLSLKYSESIGTYVDNLTQHACKNLKSALDIYEQALSIHAHSMLDSKRAELRAASMVISVRLLHEIGESPTLCGTTTFVEVGGFEMTPSDFDVGDRVNRFSRVGHELESLRKVFTALGHDEHRIPYRSSCLTYVLRNGLGGKNKDTLQDAQLQKDLHYTAVIGCFSPSSDQYTANLSYLKALDNVQSYNDILEERAKRSKRGGMQNKGGGGGKMDESSAELPRELFFQKNLMLGFAAEIAEIEKAEVNRIQAREDEEEEERAKKEEEEIALGIIPAKPKKNGATTNKTNESSKALLYIQDEKKCEEEEEEGSSMQEGGDGSDAKFSEEVKSNIAALKRQMKAMELTLKEKINLTKEMNDERLSFYKTKRTLSLLREDKLKCPYLVSLCDDEFLNGRVRRAVEFGKRTIGRMDALTIINFPLGGAGVLSNHAELTNGNNVLFLKAEGNIFVNGMQEYDTALHHGDIVSIGSAHMFMVWNRTELESMLGSSDKVLVTRAKETSKLPSLRAIMARSREDSISQLLRSSRRHWQNFETTKVKLSYEATRVSKILDKIASGGVDKSSVNDVAELENQRGSCESYILDMEEWRMRHNKIVERVTVDMFHKIQEANEISEELEKFMKFELTLVSVGGPKNNAKNDSADVDSIEFGEASVITSSSDEILISCLDLDKLDIPSFESFPAEFWIKVQYVTGENPEELWHYHKFNNRLEMMRDMFSSYITCNKDLIKLGKIHPPAIDPFYEPPTDVLIGVAYCFLDALSYMIEIHESITVINFKGKLVGELEIEVLPSMENDGGREVEEAVNAQDVDFTSEEFNISEHVGETIFISINIKSAKGIPRR